MATERKRRDDKDRHEFAWNPDYGWEILRRCPNYRTAVAQFLKAAERADDKTSLNAYKAVSLDEARHDLKQRFPFRRIPFWMRPRRGSKSRKEILRDQDEAFDFPMVPNPHCRIYGRDVVGPRYFEVDVTTKHYRKFFEWYGDLILFPINPDCVQPRPSALSALWGLYSVKIVGVANQSAALTNDNQINFSFTINTSFSKSMIEDDLRMFVRRHLGGSHTIKEKPRWSAQQFAGYLNVIDAVYPNGQKVKISHRAVGERFAPMDRLNVDDRKRAIINWAKDTRRYVESRLMPIFDRKPPRQAKKKGY